MPRRGSATSVEDRLEAVGHARSEATNELKRLLREEEYLKDQIARARQQVEYYQGLLAELKKDWGRVPTLRTLVRRL
jgi:chromosome segregation ATPase